MLRKIHRDIEKKAGCAVLDVTIIEPKKILADLKRRLTRQEKALIKTVEKGWDGKSIIEKSIIDIKKTITVVEEMIASQ